MGALTTHVLDTATGRPGNNIRLDLYRVDNEFPHERQYLLSSITNEDGRCDQPVLQGEALLNGIYEIIFHAGEYFACQGLGLPNPPFLDQVVIRFGVADSAQHYHVPLLISPYSYHTYRGS